MSTKTKKGRYFENQNKGEAAPEKILKAARKIFAEHPFSAATTRMIADEAGVDHSLIHYYFGSKENLFGAVSAELFEEFNKANLEWLEGLEKIPPNEGLLTYLERLLGYAFDHPEAFQIISLNMVQAGSMEIPGYSYIIKNIEWNQKILEDKFPLFASHPQTKMFLHSFVILVMSLMGARGSHGKMLGIDPESDAYRQYIKDSLYSIFLPWLGSFRSQKTN